jgi:hypothetical protein
LEKHVERFLEYAYLSAKKLKGKGIYGDYVESAKFFKRSLSPKRTQTISMQESKPKLNTVDHHPSKNSPAQ